MFSSKLLKNRSLCQLKRSQNHLGRIKFLSEKKNKKKKIHEVKVSKITNSRKKIRTLKATTT